MDIMIFFHFYIVHLKIYLHNAAAGGTEKRQTASVYRFSTKRHVLFSDGGRTPRCGKLRRTQPGWFIRLRFFLRNAFRKGNGLCIGRTDGIVEARTERAGQELFVENGRRSSALCGAEPDSFRRGTVVPRSEVHQRVEYDTREEPDNHSPRDMISELFARNSAEKNCLQEMSPAV